MSDKSRLQGERATLDFSEGVHEWQEGQRENVVKVAAERVVQACIHVTNGFYPTPEDIKALQAQGLAPMHDYSLGHRQADDIPVSPLVLGKSGLEEQGPVARYRDWVDTEHSLYDLNRAGSEARLLIGSATSGSAIEFTPETGTDNAEWSALWIDRLPGADRNPRYVLGAKSALYATIFAKLENPDYLNLTREQIKDRAFS